MGQNYLFRTNWIAGMRIYYFLGKNASIQGVLSDFYFLLKTNMGQNYLFRTNQIAGMRKYYFLGRFEAKKFFQVWWSQIFGWKNFQKNEIVSKPLYITF